MSGLVRGGVMPTACSVRRSPSGPSLAFQSASASRLSLTSIMRPSSTISLASSGRCWWWRRRSNDTAIDSFMTDAARTGTCGPDVMSVTDPGAQIADRDLDAALPALGPPGDRALAWPSTQHAPSSSWWSRRGSDSSDRRCRKMVHDRQGRQERDDREHHDGARLARPGRAGELLCDHEQLSFAGRTARDYAI